VAAKNDERSETPVLSTGQITLPPPAFALSPVAWSEAQLARLGAEWRSVLRAFAYHPFVAISALRGEPPTQYRVDFRVRSLVLNDAEQLQYVQTVPMEIWLPPGYPTQEPLVRPLAAVFHPNISYDAVRFGTAWQMTDTLVDVVQRVGEYLAYRSYDPDALLNEVAMQWISDNAAMLPLDTRADFKPTAGGEPLARISQFGPATLEQMRRSMEELISVLSGDAAAPNVEQVRAFGHQTRNVMRMFLVPDIPAELRTRAHEFDQFALDLPASVPSWEYVRRVKSWSKSMLADSAELAQAVAELAPEIEKLSGTVIAEFSTAEDAVRHIPAAADLALPLLRLPAMFKDAALRLESLRARLSAVDLKRPPNPLPASSLLGPLVSRKLREAEDDVEFARHAITDNITALEPALLRAREEVLALRLIARWREYIDIVTKATVLEQHLAGMSDAIEGYFIHSADGTFGPFQLEQEVELGAATVVVHTAAGGAVEVHNAKNGSTLGRGTNGTAAATLPEGNKPAAPMTFKLAEGVEQPLLQLDYACKQTILLLPKLQSAPASPATSWCGRMASLFAEVEAQQMARAEHRRCMHRWEALIEELKQLAQFKARLTTHFLLQRAAILVPRLNAERADQEAIIANSTQRIAAIVARSSRDLETGRLIVPSKYAKTYTEENLALESAKKRAHRIESRLKALSNRLRDRLASTRQCGRPEVPVLRRMQPLSTELTELAPLMSDEQLLARVSSLAKLLKTPLMANFSPPPQTKVQSAPLPMTGDLDALGAAEKPVVSEGAGATDFARGDMADTGQVVQTATAGHVESQPGAAVPQTEKLESEPAAVVPRTGEVGPQPAPAMLQPEQVETESEAVVSSAVEVEEQSSAEPIEEFFALDDDEIDSDPENDWIEQ
jgi:hypothetical protein